MELCKLLTLPDKQTLHTRLPVLTSANDIRDFVQYLKRKSAGVVAAEELDRSRRRLFEEHKLEAYRSLGITDENDGLLKLSSLGRELARRLEPETEGFRQLLNRIPTYVAAVNWMYRENFEVVTLTDLLAFWPSFHEIAEADDPEAMRGAAISFFSLCEAAELGTLTLGKRGHITRLRVDLEQLKRFVETKSVSTQIDNAVLPVTKQLRVLVVKRGDTDLVDLVRRTIDTTQTNSLWLDRDWDVKASITSDLSQYAKDYDALLVIMDDELIAKLEPCNCMENTLPWAVGLELINTIESFKSKLREISRA